MQAAVRQRMNKQRDHLLSFLDHDSVDATTTYPLAVVAVEGINSKLKLAFKRAFSFCTADAREVAFFHALGKLPEPQFNPQFLLDRR
jgi:hypothetical protein